MDTVENLKFIILSETDEWDQLFYKLLFISDDEKIASFFKIPNKNIKIKILLFKYFKKTGNIPDLNIKNAIEEEISNN